MGTHISDKILNESIHFIYSRFHLINERICNMMEWYFLKFKVFAEIIDLENYYKCLLNHLQKKAYVEHILRMITLEQVILFPGIQVCLTLESKLI